MSKWIYPNLDKQLIANVDNVVNHISFGGSPKYKDRKDFIVKAIQQLLDKEMKKVEVCTTR